jgi:hypothetical protein
MRLRTWANICRFHLLQRLNYYVLPVAVLAFGFVVDVVILELTPAGHAPHRAVGGLGSIYVLVFVLGVQSVARSLPFAMASGVSRRSYYLGTALLAGAFATAYGLLIMAGQALERATSGWGIKMAFFRVPYILDGPWYLTWFTSAVTLALMFIFGTWFGLVYRRWRVVGTVAFTAALVASGAGAAVAITWAAAWGSLGHFLANVSALGLTGLLAAVVALLVAGGLATVRRISL